MSQFLQLDHEHKYECYEYHILVRYIFFHNNFEMQLVFRLFEELKENFHLAII